MPLLMLLTTAVELTKIKSTDVAAVCKRRQRGGGKDELLLLTAAADTLLKLWRRQ